MLLLIFREEGGKTERETEGGKEMSSVASRMLPDQGWNP